MSGSIEVEGLWKAYGTSRALRDVNLSISRSEFSAVTGASGLGKNALAKTMALWMGPVEGGGFSPMEAMP